MIICWNGVLVFQTDMLEQQLRGLLNAVSMSIVGNQAGLVSDLGVCGGVEVATARSLWGMLAGQNSVCHNLLSSGLVWALQTRRGLVECCAAC